MMVIGKDAVSEIVLFHGEVTKIDPADSVRLCRIEWSDGCAFEARPIDVSWHARKTKHSTYAVTSKAVGGKIRYVALHRLIAGPKPDEDVDHRNCDGLDNRSCNLRVCSRSLNNANQRPRVGRLLPKGVAWSESMGKFQAYIGANRKKYNLGYFDSADDAAAAYAAKAVQLFGDYARTDR